MLVNANGGRAYSKSTPTPPSSSRKLPQPLNCLSRINLPIVSNQSLSDSFLYRLTKIKAAIQLILIFNIFIIPLVISLDEILPVPTMVQTAFAEDNGEVRFQPTLVTAETLQAKIDEVSSSVDLTEQEKNELLELYRKSLSNLESIKSNQEATETFRKEIKAAPEQIESIKKEISELTQQREALNAGKILEIPSPVDELVELLQSQQAELAAANAARADIIRRLSYINVRPAAISKRLAEAEQEQNALEADLNSQDSDGDKVFAEAQRWVLETGYIALSTEIAMLNEEVLRKPLLTSLLEAKLRWQEAKIELIKERLDSINNRLNKERILEAEKVQREAEKAQLQAKGRNPVLVKVAKQNAELTKEINKMTAQLESLAKDHDQVVDLNTRVTANFQDAQNTLELSGLTEGLGKVLLAQQSYLPGLEHKKDEVRERDERIAEVEVLRLQLQAEARRIDDVDSFMNQLAEEAKVAKSADLFAELQPLVESRKQLLGKVMDMIDVYLTGLRQLNQEERKLLESVTAYQQFLRQNLLWLRNAEPTRLTDFLELPREVRNLHYAMTQASFAETVKSHLINKPLFWLSILLVLYLIFRRRTCIFYIREKSKIVGRPTTDSIGITLMVCLVTALMEVPGPLMLAVSGWLLEWGGQPEPIGTLGRSLISISMYFFCLRFFRAVCMPKGLVEAHFRWPEDNLKLLRKELDRLFFIMLPAGLLIILSINLRPENDVGILARLSFFIVYLALIFFLYRVLHPNKGVLAHLRGEEHSARILHLYPILFFMLILFPIILIYLTFAGYLYSVKVVSDMFGRTLLLIFGLVMLKSLFLRWLGVVHRRLSYAALLEKRRARLEEQKEQKEQEVAGTDEESALQIEEPEVDVATLTDETRQFVTVAVFVAGLLGLYLIWSPFLPALKILDEVGLWHITVKEAGVEKQLPITLANLGLAIIYAVTVAIVAKWLPSLLEIILLRRTSMTSGDRYTVTTLANYAIITVGAVVVLNTIGAQWSQLQWLVAALGVGIGFGLQEIIANFISGLIILFEQPVRVGDIVTIGDTDGVVTKIRIRATTIRNWDRKELLVPNKEFITGRLLNWSLADQVTRIFIMIGIAYGSDVDKAMKLIRQAAEVQEHVMEDPAPTVNFESFGDNSLNLSLRAYVDNIDYRLSTMTEIHREINRLFAEADIQIPFPQRDIHLDCQQPLRVKIEDQQ